MIHRDSSQWKLLSKKNYAGSEKSLATLFQTIKLRKRNDFGTGWFCGWVSSQYLTSMRRMRVKCNVKAKCCIQIQTLHWRMLRSLGRCCLGKVDLLMAGGAAEVHLVSLSVPPAIPTKNPPSFIASMFFFAEMGSIRTAGGKPIFVWEAGWKERLW
jgi:hypothetical protein